MAAGARHRARGYCYITLRALRGEVLRGRVSAVRTGFPVSVAIDDRRDFRSTGALRRPAPLCDGFVDRIELTGEVRDRHIGQGLLGGRGEAIQRDREGEESAFSPSERRVMPPCARHEVKFGV
jgi:hypothetical protein